MALTKSPYKGTRDFFPKQMRLRNFIFHKMAEVSERFAYEPYDGPILEEIDLYRAKSGDELINEQVYSFVDRGDREVAIRPEMTPTVARMVAQIHREVAKPIRWYAIPNLMRYEKPQKGRLREFWQYNADIFGAGQNGAVEIIQVAISIMKSFGANSSQFEILINDRRFVDAVFAGLIDLPADLTKKLYKLVDAKNKMDAAKFTSEVRAITNDEKKALVFEEFVNLKTITDVEAFAKKHFSDETIENQVKPLVSIFAQFNDLGLNEFVSFEPSIVRGLDYYTGMVFEIFDKHPDNRRAIAGGGAYANLLQIFNEQPLEGVGMGLGEVPLTEFLNTHGLTPDFSRPQLDFFVAHLDADGNKLAADVASKLRDQNKKVELYFEEAKIKKVFKYTDNKDVAYVVFIENNEIRIRDMKLKTEKPISLENLIAGNL